MTIKQQGGIFGRNPTFNDLTVEGTLTSSGTFAPSGQVTFSEDGDAALVVNRNTNSGTIVQVKQANAEVGYIATYGGDLIVGTGDTSMRFIDSLDCYFPVSNATGTTRDNAIDIGYTEARYKDLYLGGGIYLQASSATPVAANYLDDYEEGNWVPVLTDFTNNSPTSARGAYYTKVGNIVFASCNFINVDTTGMTSGAELYLDGLPYTSKSTTGTNYFVAGGVQYSGTSVTNQPIPSIVDGTDYMRFFDSGTFWNVSNLTDDAADLYINVVYLAE